MWDSVSAEDIDSIVGPFTNSDKSLQFENTKSTIDQFVDITIDREISLYEAADMWDSVSAEDMDSIVGPFTSNIMDTYIDEAQDNEFSLS
jgi:hypothetical protein